MAESTSHDIQRTDEVTMAESTSHDIQRTDEDASILDMFKKLDDKEKAARERTRHVYDAGQQMDLHQHRWLEAIEKVVQDANKVADTRMKLYEVQKRASLLLAESNVEELVKEECERSLKSIKESMELTLKWNQEKRDSSKRLIDSLQQVKREATEMSKKLKLYAAKQTQVTMAESTSHDIQRTDEDASKVADTRKDIAEVRDCASPLLAKSNYEMVKEACQRRMKILEESEDLSYKGDQEKENSTNTVKDYLRENERCWRELSREVEQYDATRQQMGQEIRRIKNVFEEKRRARDAAREP